MPLDASGSLVRPGPAPSLPDASAYPQSWIVDPDATLGIAATNRVRTRLP